MTKNEQLAERPVILIAATVPNFFLFFLHDLLTALVEDYCVCICCPANKDLETFCAKHGVIFEPLDIARKPSPLRDVRTAARVIAILHKYKPDLTMTYTPKAGVILSLCSYFRSTGIFVHNFTGLIFPYRKGIRRYFLAGLDRFILRSADFSIAESHGVRRQLETLNVSNAQIDLVGDGNISGIDFSRFPTPSLERRTALRTKYGLNDTFTYGLFVGRINPDKGVLELLEATAALREEAPEFQLWLAGAHDDNRAYCDAFEAARKDRPELRYLGRRNDIAELMQAVDFVVLPTQREGFSNVMLEAQAAGAPLLITDVPGVEETVKRTGLGVVVPANTASDLTYGLRTMFRLIETISFANRQTCAEWIRSHYDREQVMDNYRIMIETTLSGDRHVNATKPSEK